MVSDIALLVLFICLHGFFKMHEAAFNELNLKKIHFAAEEGEKTAQALEKYLEKKDTLECSLQFCYIICFIAAEFFFVKVYQNFNFIKVSGLSHNIFYNIIAVIVFAMIILLFGNIISKALGSYFGEKLVLATKTLILAFSFITLPFVLPCLFIGSGINKIIGMNSKESETGVTQKEIRSLVDEGNDTGAIDLTEKEMINNIFEFNTTMAGEIATHRTDIVAVPSTASLENIIEVISEEKFSRIPVYNENVDDIIGFFRVRDLLKFYLNGKNGRDFKLKKILHEPYFVPFSKKIDELFEDMQKNKVHMAIVIDEYGGTAGIVTMEDLIEEIMGNIFDEYDVEEEEITEIDENTFLIKGTTELDEVEEILDINFKDGEDYDTIGGFIIGQLGRIPDENEHPELIIDNLIIKVEKIDDKRIEFIKISKEKEEEVAEV